MKNALGKHWFLVGMAVVVCFGLVWPGAGLAIKRSGAVPWIVAGVMFLSGLSLATGELLSQFKKPHALLLAFGMTYAILPLLAWLLARALFSDNVGLLVGIMVMAAQSSTLVSGIVLTGMARGSTALALLVTLINNSSSALMTPLILRLSLARGEIALDAGMMVLKIALVILLPVAAGQVVRALAPRVADRLKPYTSKFSQCCILVMVLIGIANAAAILKADPAFVALLIGAMLGLHVAALLTIWALGGALRLDRPSRIGVMMCSSQKTLPAAVYVAETFFPLYALAAVPAIIYHVSQLVLDSALAARLGGRPDAPEEPREKADSSGQGALPEN